MPAAGDRADGRLESALESAELVTGIYRATAGRANLMTTACDELVKSPDLRERVI
jgi:hypothetical protein